MAGDDSDWLDSSPSYPNKRRAVTEDPQSSRPAEEEMYSRCCGICLLEEGKSIRGHINSCDHYFCFICIMEWSRIESRCPMCKQRFTTIRRPTKAGVFSSDRIINVPERNQVYNGLGNASVGIVDPYQFVSCSVCNGVTDESLLLLCDLCDVAAHTYCVGLGATVPEGDWFCGDCTILRAEHHDTETETEADSAGQDVVVNSRVEHNNTGVGINTIDTGQSLFPNFESENRLADVVEYSDSIPSANANVSIFDIVHEELSSRKSHQVESLFLNKLATPVVCGTSSRSSDGNHVGALTELDARTLSHCRDVQRRIRALRENWNKLQSGSLSFSSSVIELGERSGSRRHNISKLLDDRSGVQQSSSSLTLKQARGQGGNVIHYSHRISTDVDKAWKMLKIAKSMPHRSHRTASAHQVSKHSSISGSASKLAASTSSAIKNSKILQFGEIHRSAKSKMVEQSEAVNSSEKQSPSSTNISIQFYSNGNVTRPVAAHVHGSSSSFEHEQGCSSKSVNVSKSTPRISNPCNSKAEVNTSSSNTTARKDATGKTLIQSKPRADDDTKSEIQSLVKLNLKLLSKEKKLETRKFKEVARLATHTILAACGLEHRKSCIHPFPINVVCSHTEDTKQVHKSLTLLTSCKECFSVFVKDVVHSILFGESGHTISG